MLSRVTAVRRIPRVFVTPVRLYTDSRKEGSVAQSKGFSSKEKAHEDQYVRQHEAEQLAKLKAKLSKNEQERSKLQAQHDELEKKLEDK